MSLDPAAANLTRSGRRDTPPQTPAAASYAPRTRPYRLTVDLPPAVHTQFSRWIIDAEEQLGRNVDKRAVILALIDTLTCDAQLRASLLHQLRSGN